MPEQIDYIKLATDRYSFLIETSKGYRMGKSWDNVIDNAIFNICSVNCESQINGVECVYEQLFDKDTELQDFISILKEINEDELAEKFKTIADILLRGNHWTPGTRSIESLATNDKETIVGIMNDIIDNQKLDALDLKLGRMLAEEQNH